jgi:hypothetical protein
MILRCDCAHQYQDQKYGKGNRVHNEMKPGSNKVRCSVCGKEKVAK